MIAAIIAWSLVSPAGMASVFDQAPTVVTKNFGFYLRVVATTLAPVFFVTSGDSTTLVLRMTSTGGDPDPGANVKLVWGPLVRGIAASPMLARRVKAAQTATIVSALPFTAFIVSMALALWGTVRAHRQAGQDEERRLRRRLRDLAAR